MLTSLALKGYATITLMKTEGKSQTKPDQITKSLENFYVFIYGAQ